MHSPVKMDRADSRLIVLALGLAIGGTMLAAVGAAFLSGWVDVSQNLQTVTGCQFGSLCPQQLAAFNLPPNPFPVFVAYLLAIPLGAGAGFLLDRHGRRLRDQEPAESRVFRIVGIPPMAAMIWMAALYSVGVLFGVSLGPRNLSLTGLAYLSSLVVVPSLVVGAGGTLLVHEVSGAFISRIRAARR